MQDLTWAESQKVPSWTVQNRALGPPITEVVTDRVEEGYRGKSTFPTVIIPGLQSSYSSYSQQGEQSRSAPEEDDEVLQRGGGSGCKLKESYCRYLWIIITTEVSIAFWHGDERRLRDRIWSVWRFLWFGERSRSKEVREEFASVSGRVENV